MHQHCLVPKFPVVFALLAAGLVTLEAAQPAGAQAIPGVPFGIGSVTVPISGAIPGEFVETGGYLLRERDGRACYPVFLPGGLLERLGELAGADIQREPSQVTALFLFEGTEPLDLTIYTPAPRRITLVPRPEPTRRYNRLLSQWWRSYHAVAGQQARIGDHPPLVHTYLTSMLSARLARRPPLLRRVTASQPDETQQTFQLLAGAEGLRDATMRATLEGTSPRGERADQPVPDDVLWSPSPTSEVTDGVDIETMAMHVPEECFYIRFGTFEDYLWFGKLTREFGGDLGRMISLRGHSLQLHERMQRQLALRENALAELLGGQVTAAVALIGRDAYLREGAAVGVLLQAKNNLAISADVTRQRTEALVAEKERGATLETVNVNGHEVSFLSTPDNLLRSFYAVDGDFHLVTTSRVIVERFFAAGQGEGALGASHEFRHARTLMPLSREDTAFAYFSTAFFRGLLSPHYQIELSRRLEAVTDIELVYLAKLAAAAEGKPSRTIAELVSGELLPPGLGKHADGSGPILETHRVVDSLRGARGNFLPIPDVTLRGATQTEVAQYLSRARYYEANWRQLDPLIVGIRREAHERKGGERLVIDANISPLGEEKYGWLLSLLGPPTPRRIATGPKDILTLQGFVTGGLLSPVIPPHHLFVSVEDSPVAVDRIPKGLGEILWILRTTPGYLGTWPKPGFLDRLPVRIETEPDSEGFSQLPLGLWRWQGGDFSTLSFHRNVLARAATELRVEEAATPAQLRVHVGDLSASSLTDWVNLLYYRRARQASVGNVRLLHTLSNQLKVPRAEALDKANELLGTQLVCSIGGEYEYEAKEDGVGVWRSTRWESETQVGPPEDYQAPLLKWFRGLDLEVTKIAGRLQLHAELDIQREQKGKLDLPILNLFGGRQDNR